MATLNCFWRIMKTDHDIFRCAQDRTTCQPRLLILELTQGPESLYHIHGVVSLCNHCTMGLNFSSGHLCTAMLADTFRQAPDHAAAVHRPTGPCYALNFICFLICISVTL